MDTKITQLKHEAQAILDKLSAKLEEVQAQKSSVQDDLQSEYDEKIAKLEEIRAKLQEKIDSLADATDDKIEDLTSDINGVVNELKAPLTKIQDILGGDSDDESDEK